MRLVLDTNVVVSGLLWRGSPRQVIEAGRQGMAAFFSSAILLDELASVLKRDKFSALLTSRKVTPSLLMRRYGMFATLVDPAPVEHVVQTDEDDDHVVATALGARADAIVTGDRDLLRLHPCQGIRILDPVDALRYMRRTAGSSVCLFPGLAGTAGPRRSAGS